MIDKLSHGFINSVYHFNDYTLNELICKLAQKMDEVITQSNESFNYLEWLKGQGLSDEVIKILIEWKENGTFDKIINNQLFNKLNNTINEVSTQMEHIANNTYGYVSLKKYEYLVENDDWTLALQTAINENNKITVHKDISTSSPVLLKNNVIIDFNNYVITNIKTSVFINFNGNIFSQGFELNNLNLRGDTNTNQTIPHLIPHQDINKHLFIDCPYDVSSYSDSNTGLTITHNYNRLENARCGLHFKNCNNFKLNNIYVEGFDIGYHFRGGSMITLNNLKGSWNKIGLRTNSDPYNPGGNKITTVNANNLSFSYNYINCEFLELQDSIFNVINSDRSSLAIYTANCIGNTFIKMYEEANYDAWLDEGAFGDKNVIKDSYFYWINDKGKLKLQRGKWLLKDLRGKCKIDVTSAVVECTIDNINTEYEVITPTLDPTCYFKDNKNYDLLYKDPYFLLNGYAIDASSGIASLVYENDETGAKNILVARGTGTGLNFEGIRILLPSINIPNNEYVRVEFDYKLVGEPIVPFGVKIGSDLLVGSTIPPSDNWTKYKGVVKTLSNVEISHAYGHGGFTGELEIKNLYIYIGDDKITHKNLLAPSDCTCSVRPTKGLYDGYKIFDKNINKEIIYVNNKWVDVSGQDV